MIPQIFSVINAAKFGSDGDVIDRLNYRYTPWILCCLAIFLSTTPFVGPTIKCWTPVHFPDQWTAFTDDFCWVKNTYYVDIETYIEPAKENEEDYEIKYYQWVPIMLALSAVLFYVPRLIWQFITAHAGIDMNSMVSKASSYDVVISGETRQKTIDHLVAFLDRYLDNSAISSSVGNDGKTAAGNPLSRSSARYMSFGYLLIKLLYLVNIGFHLLSFESLLGEGFGLYSPAIFKLFTEGPKWTNMRRFPRVTFCDFSVRVLGNVQDYTIQCVLPINLFNEKAFLFLWWWFLCLGIFSLFNLIGWIVRIYWSGDSKSYVKKHLKSLDVLRDEDEPRLTNFVNTYLKSDGIFVTRLLARNASALITSEVVCGLWKHFNTNYGEEMAMRQNQEEDDEEEPESDDNDDYTKQGTKDRNELYPRL